MSHITVQLGPCCTAPLDALGPEVADDGHEPPSRGRGSRSAAGLSDCMRRHIRRKPRRERVRAHRTAVR